MAGQKGSLHFQASLGISADLGFDQDSITRIELLAKERGLSVQKLISEIILEHLDKFDTVAKVRIESERYPLRFNDPADQISVDEDFRDLI